jgi:hypothetical protein
MANHYSGWHDAAVKCKRAATDQAQYGTPSWRWFSFSTFYSGDTYVAKGIATLVEPDAQFQNGFGAMVHSRVTCNFDLRTEEVTGVSIMPR